MNSKTTKTKSKKESKETKATKGVKIAKTEKAIRTGKGSKDNKAKKKALPSSKLIEFTNDFMFATIMQGNKDICRRVLECILDFEIESIEYVEDQYALQTYIDSHGVRLDVIAKDTGAIYDIEMQTVDDDDIPRRMRYYQSQIDVSELKKGEQYKTLKESYIIFICKFDIFGRDEYIYRFENYDAEKLLPLGDGTKKIVINSTGTKGSISDDLKAFISYIDKPREIRKSRQTELVADIDTQVVKTNEDSKWRNMFMKYEIDLMKREEKGRAEGRKEGKKEGRKEGRAEGIAEGIAKGIAKGKVEGRKEGIAEGIVEGIAKGERKGLEIATKIFRLFRDGKSEKQIARTVGVDISTVRAMLG